MRSLGTRLKDIRLLRFGFLRLASSSFLNTTQQLLLIL